LKTPIIEHESRAGHKIFDGIRDQNLAALGESGNARSDVNGNAGEL
jgi:hypothetical protein